ncbi:MAG: MFS transporter [Eggerthellaceae bacterium]|nr:MFS transporter [Eggerthellaceae bacterium]
METKKKLFYGWPLTFILGLILFCSGAAIMPIASIVNPMMLSDPDMKLTGTLLGVGFTVLVLMQGLPAPLIGQFIAKKGARFCMTIGALLMIVGALGMIFFVRDAASYIICFGILLGLGASMAGLLAVQSTIGNWFSKKRGVAMTIMMTTGALAAIVLPLVVNAIVAATDGAWQSGWWLFCGFGVLIIPLAVFFVKNRPADIGEEPDGIASSLDPAKEKKQVKVYQTKEAIPFTTVLKSPNYWLISLAATGGFCGFNITFTQGIIHFTALGFEPAAIVGAVSVMGIANITGKLTVGALSDRFEPIRLMSLCLFVIAAGIFVATAAQNIVVVYTFYILVGFGFGSISGNMATALANYFGLLAYSKNLGTLMTCTTIVSSAIPVMSGAIFDATGFCTLAFYIVGTLVALCAVCALLVKIPKK